MITDTQLTFIANTFGVITFFLIVVFHYVTNSRVPIHLSVQQHHTPPPMLSSQINEWTQIGIGLTLFGVLFIILGILMLFDKGLIAMGNLLFVAGIILIIGLQRTISFFTRRWKGGLCFIGGFSLVLIGWPITGMLVELFGFINLFGDFFPTLVVFLVNMPVIGPIFVPIQKMMSSRRRLPV